MKIENPIQHEHAVSETVGFILIFGIMLTGIGLITLYGYPALLDAQQNANIRNMERNMISLQSDVKSLVYKSVPYKETTMQVSGGTMLIRKDGGLNSKFYVDNGTINQSFPTGGIIYNSQDDATTICLENGAVHTRRWSFEEGSAMLSEPRWFYDKLTNTFVMTFITMDATDDFAQTGVGTVAMRLNPRPTQINATASTRINVTYDPDITNDFRIAWKNYFDSFKPVMEPLSNTTYQLGTGVNLIIKWYNVTVLSL
ncbi:MAG TPA: hypothetical protein PLN56_09325 [Methanoregulaceae archaeon]|mgnify:CR=1 FL=1|nr:MAG: hypothetical protein IPI71_05620 [Methanolinea sp.]HON82356.1 hypothetical protein [Methanoregulaceae archaeon]HPD11177.1 hypothetical protein [Methanoregulaceae archaeon]HRT16173.1 hypothetical protein [Methanoregulaceae archaeon]HRU31744.1 hypothetical protein [Methanoregulaceae archaeon]